MQLLMLIPSLRELLELDARSVAIDQLMIELDGTPNKGVRC